MNGRIISGSFRQQRCAVLRRSLFIDTETTPNPHSLKFVPGKQVLPEKFGTGMYFKAGELKQIHKSPLAKSLFSIEGVKGIFLGRDFLTVTKDSETSWVVVKPQVFSKMFDFYAEGKDVVEENLTPSDTAVLDTDDEIVATIKELIETRIRPSVQEDGGDIFYSGFNPKTGIVSVSLAGACVGCPSSAVTLRNGVENMLMHYIPEVKGIENVSAAESEQPSVLSFANKQASESSEIPVS